MRALSIVAASVMAVGVVACSRPAPDEFGKADVDNIRKLIQDFVPAYNAKDAAKVATFFSGGAVVMPPNAPTMRGVEAIEQYYVARFAQGATDLSLEPTDVAGHGPLAYVSGDYRLKMAPPGGPERPDRGKFLFILREAAGKWALEYLMFSSDFAPTPPA
jgi:uncharacterized protein (TIGR02246 family)